MSDPAQDTETPASTGTAGKWFTSEDFSGITVDGKVLAFGATAADSDTGQNIIQARIEAAMAKAGSDKNDGETWKAWAEGMANAIFYSLPEDARYEETLQAIDLRPYVQVAINNPDTRPSNYNVRWNPDRELRGGEAEHALEGFQLGYDEVVGKVQLGSKRTDEQKASAAETWRQFDPTTAGMAPEPLMAWRQQQVDETATSSAEAETALLDQDPTAVLLGEEDTGPTADPIVFPEEELRQMLRTGALTNLNDLAATETQFNKDAGTSGFVPVELGMTGSPDMPGVDRVRQRTLNAADAMDWITNLSEEEVATLQVNLAKAGYFEQLQGFTKYESGYQYDPATQAAWQLALTDSVKQKKPLPQILAERAVAETKRRKDQFAAFSTSNSRKAANQMAIDAIGRELDPEEYEMVRSFLIDLRVKRSNAVTGIDDMSWQNTETVQTGYSQDDVATAVEQAVTPEIASSNSWNAGQKLFQFMGMDFPGTQRTED